MRRLLNALERASIAATSFLLVLVTVVLSIQVFTRYVLDSSTPWSEELARYSIVWLTLLTQGVVIRRFEEIRVDILEHYLAQRGIPARFLGIFLLALEVAFIVILVVSAIRLLPTARTQMITGLQVPLSYVIWGFVFGPVLALPFLFERIYDVFVGNPASLSEE